MASSRLLSSFAVSEQAFVREHAVLLFALLCGVENCLLAAFLLFEECVCRCQRPLLLCAECIASDVLGTNGTVVTTFVHAVSFFVRSHLAFEVSSSFSCICLPASVVQVLIRISRVRSGLR